MKKNLMIAISLASALLGSAFALKAQHPTFNHLALYVTNLQKSTWFYKEVLGLDTMPEPFHDGRHTWFRIGPHAHLHLISGAVAGTEHNKNTHLCFSVFSIPD